MKKSKPLLDICFILDATGSMWPYMKTISALIPPLSESIKKSQIDLKISLILYRDYKPQDYTFVIKKINFTKRIKKIKNYINKIKAQGGGDGPEALERALFEISRLNWRKKSKKICFIITDAPPHGIGEPTDEIPDPQYKINDKLIFELIKYGIELNIFGIEPAILEYQNAIDFYINLCSKINGKYYGTDISEYDLLDNILEIIKKKMNLNYLSINYKKIIKKFYSSDKFIYKIKIRLYLSSEIKKIKKSILKFSKTNSSILALGSRYRDLARNKLRLFELKKDKQYLEESIIFYFKSIKTFYNAYNDKHDNKFLLQIANCSRDLSRIFYMNKDEINDYEPEFIEIKNFYNLMENKLKIVKNKFDLDLSTLYKITYIFSIYLYIKLKFGIFAALLCIELFNKTNNKNINILHEAKLILDESLKYEKSSYKKAWILYYINKIIQLTFLIKYQGKNNSPNNYLTIYNYLLKNYLDAYYLTKKYKPLLFYKINFSILFFITFLKLYKYKIIYNIKDITNDFDKYYLSNFDNLLIKILKNIYNNNINKTFLNTIIEKLEQIISYLDKYIPTKIIIPLNICSHKSYHFSYDLMLKFFYIYFKYIVTKKTKNKLLLMSLIKIFNTYNIYDPVSIQLNKNNHDLNLFNPLWFLFELNIYINIFFVKEKIIINEEKTVTTKVNIIVNSIPLSFMDKRIQLIVKSDNDIELLNENPILNKIGSIKEHNITIDFSNMKIIPNNFKIGAFIYTEGINKTRIELSKDWILCSYNIHLNKIKKSFKTIIKYLLEKISFQK